MNKAEHKDLFLRILFVIGATIIIGLPLCIGLYSLSKSGDYQAVLNDNYFHMGYQECLNDKVNLTSDELMNLNQYRVCKLENKKMGCG